MGGDDTGSRVSICHDISKDPSFSGHVQSGGGFIKKQDRIFAKQGYVDGKSLGLTL